MYRLKSYKELEPIKCLTYSIYFFRVYIRMTKYLYIARLITNN